MTITYTDPGSPSPKNVSKEIFLLSFNKKFEAFALFSTPDTVDVLLMLKVEVWRIIGPYNYRARFLGLFATSRVAGSRKHFKDNRTS
jgi:hypothetical protein